VGPPGRSGTTPPKRSAGTNPPGVDIDRVAAMLNTNDKGIYVELIKLF